MDSLFRGTMPREFVETPLGMPASLAFTGGICAFLLMTRIPDYGLTNPLPMPFPAPSFFVFILGAIATVAHLLQGRFPTDRMALWLFVWAGAYLLLGGSGLALAGFGDTPLEEFKNRIYAVISLYGAFTLGRDPRGRRALVTALLLALALDLAMAGFEVLRPGTFSAVNGRAAGLFLNPTISGMAMAATLLAAWGDLPAWSQGPLFGLVTLGVLGTFSRGSMLGWLLVWLGAWPLGFWRGRQALVWNLLFLGGISLLILAIQSGLLASLHWEVLNANTLNRIQFGLGDDSAQERVQILGVAWQKIAESPWIGYGLGAPHRFHPQGTHNMFLYSWVEHGILGTLLLPALLAPLAWARPHGRMFLAFFLLMGFFSHNLLDERPFLVPLAFLLALVPPEALKHLPARGDP